MPAYSSYEGIIAKSEKLSEAQESELYLNKPLKLMLVVEANGKKNGLLTYIQDNRSSFKQTK